MRFPCDHTTATLTGVSLLVCRVNFVRALTPELVPKMFLGDRIRKWYCGLAINDLCVQFPPAVLRVMVPET